MTHTFDIDAALKLLVRMLLMLCVLFLGVTAATPSASAFPCGDGPCDEEPCGGSEVSAEAEDPCSTPCSGESPEDGDCLDDCQFCSCCSMVAPAAIVHASLGSGLNALAFRGDLPPRFKVHFGGINPGVFKPPRHLSA